MKRSGLILLCIILLTYGYQGYKIYHDHINHELKVKESGLLSDISDNVTPIKLETPNDGKIVKQIKRVQRDGDNIFLLSGHKLLHFDISGKFINNIAKDISDSKEEVFIADYTIDSDRHQIIVIDSSRNIHKYDYDGRLISKAKINHPWNKLMSFTYHNGHIWATAETLKKNPKNDSYWIFYNLYKLDLDMNEISKETLRFADTGRDKRLHSLRTDEILVDEQGVYAYSSPVDMKYLLDDTLHIIHQDIIPVAFGSGYQGQACVYPVRKSKRYMMSTHYDSQDSCYTYCYDKSNNTAYLLQKGFKDNVYNTGYVTDLQPMDIYNKSYCYIKDNSGNAENISEKTDIDNPVLYIVTLKS